MPRHPIDDEIYTFDDIGKNAPRLSYNRKIKKIVFENYEAFWLLLHATKHPDIINGVIFETDDNFKTHYIKQTGDKGLNNLYINKFILKEMMEAMNVSEQHDNFQGSFQDKNMHLWMTNQNESENMEDAKVLSSKSQSERQKRFNQKTKEKEQQGEERMNAQEFLEWSSAHVEEDLKKRIDAGDTNWKFL
jgi:hypothetical protein